MGEQDRIPTIGQARLSLRLVLVDVEPGSFDPSFLERPDQGFLVDDRPPRGIDQIVLRPHQLQLALADQVPRLVVQVGVDADVVRLSQQFVERHVLGA